MKSTFDKKDVILLLKDISGLVTPQSTKEREQLIQRGTHYCEMLPVEYSPTPGYLEAFEQALEHYSRPTALAVCQLAEKLYQTKGPRLVLVSLARGGTPIGILLKHYLLEKYQIDVAHYSISIIRGRGIDQNAVRFLLSNHQAENIQFVDGWIGKGAIQKELNQSLLPWPKLSPKLAVLCDPANITSLCGTHEDFLIPSSCLNSTVCGLISRTFLRDDIISETDFHGAAFYPELKSQDLSYSFIRKIEAHFDFDLPIRWEPMGLPGIDEVTQIGRHFRIQDMNFIKPGIGETTRVLLRRLPWKLLIQEGLEADPSMAHLLKLAAEKNIPVEKYPLVNYKACGIIQKVADA